MNVVIGTEGYDFLVRCNIMYYASADAVDVEVVAVHKSHAAQ